MYRLAEDAGNEARIAAIEDYNDYARFDVDDDQRGYDAQPLPAITLRVPVTASATATALSVSAAPKSAPRIYPAFNTVGPDGFTDNDVCEACGAARQYDDGGPLSWCEPCESRCL